MDFNSTVKCSVLEGFYPEGWDFEKIDACIDASEKITEHQSFRNEGFTPVKCDSLGEFENYIGPEMQWQGMSLWITTSYIPTLLGRLFLLKDLAGPLTVGV